MQKVIGATLIAATALATTAALADNAASEQSERLAAELAAANADKSPQTSLDRSGVLGDFFSQIGVTFEKPATYDKTPVQRSNGFRWERNDPAGR